MAACTKNRFPNLAVAEEDMVRNCRYLDTISEVSDPGDLIFPYKYSNPYDGEMKVLDRASNMGASHIVWIYNYPIGSSVSAYRCDDWPDRTKWFINFYLVATEMNNRKMYNTTLDSDLIKQIKILAAQLEKRQNDLLEEAIEDLLRKYEKKPHHNPLRWSSQIKPKANPPKVENP